MASNLHQEIQQRKPFASREQEVFLSVLRTADAFTQALDEEVRAAGLSHTQYNVLRILRGAGTRGLSCREIGERMLTHDPDITRLLDRLERRALVTRHRDAADRRVVTARITADGLQLLEDLDAPVEQMHQRLLGHLDPERLASLAALLEQARGPRTGAEVESGESGVGRD